MRIQLILAMLLLAISSCQSDPDQASDTAAEQGTTATPPPLSTDDMVRLRATYQEYYEKLEPKLPLQCVT